MYELINELDGDNIKLLINKFKHKYKISLIKEKIKIINKAKKENNYLSNHRPEISFGIRSLNDIKNLLSSNLGQLILEITERCNQRCKYCSFSGRYLFKRAHGTKDISFETAKKAVDFFMERSEKSKNKKPNIGFYGGEPLLKFELIKRIIDYIKYNNKFGRYRFSLTTNGTLLHKEIVDYLDKNDISITISLDGPKNIHDRYRVFRNGKGTFDIIIKNIERIKKYNCNYFKNNISFNVVMSPPYNIKDILSFFYRNRLFEEIGDKFQFNSVDPYETTFFKDFNLEIYLRNFYKEVNKLRKNYKNSLIAGNYKDLTIEKKLFDENFYQIEYRPMEFLGKLYAPQGACIPGQRRLFIDINGRFFICERVGRNFEIGDVYNGFDYRKIYDFYERYKDFFKSCKYCWALRLCLKCFNNIRRGENFDERRRNQMCKIKLNSIKKDLITYCEIREKNPNAFKSFKYIKVM
ncbi:MAG: radical SAM protein [Methanosarcinales archaeon]